MSVTTHGLVEVGVRELKSKLSRYLDEVAGGVTIVVTERGRPAARIVAIDEPTSHLAALTAAGVVRTPTSRSRHRPTRVRASWPVSELVDEQRR